jgi:hypothetical protein
VSARTRVFDLEKKPMKRIRLVVTVLAAAVLATACFKHSYTFGAGGNTHNSPAYSSWHGHWILGFFGDETVNVSSICPSGNATVTDEHSFVNLIIAALIGELYYPTTVEVYCDGRVARLELSPEQLRAMGRNPRTMAYVRDAAPEQAPRLAQAIEIDQSAVCRAGLAAR